MDQNIFIVSGRGVGTLPKCIRKQVPFRHFKCFVQGKKIILEPLHTQEELIAELDEIEAKWEKSGKALTLEEYSKKYGL